MRLKSILLLSTVLFSTIFFFNGCIKEESINEPEQPIAVFRLGNFTENVPSVKVKFIKAGVTVFEQTVAQYAMTDFTVIPAGSVNVYAINPATNDTIIKRVNFALSGIDVNSFIFNGFYSSLEEKNSCDMFEMIHGKNYVNHAPEKGKFSIHFLYLAGPYKDDPATMNPGRMDVWDVSANPDTLVLVNQEKLDKSASELVPGYNNLTPGLRQYWVTKLEKATDVYAKDSTVFAADKNYFYIITGHGTSLTKTLISSTPPPVRER